MTEKSNDTASPSSNVFIDIWSSFRSLPGWVQIWMGAVLMPVNMASIFFTGEPKGVIIAVLAYAGMMFNLPILIIERGMSKLMSIAHILPWTALVMILIFARPAASGTYDAFLWILLITNLVSLYFDYVDGLKWIKGDRAVAR